MPIPDWLRWLLAGFIAGSIVTGSVAVWIDTPQFPVPTPSPSLTSDLKILKIKLIREDTLRPQPNFKVEVVGGGPQPSKPSDIEGYVEVQMPERSRNTVTVTVSGPGYKASRHTIDLGGKGQRLDEEVKELFLPAKNFISTPSPGSDSKEPDSSRPSSEKNRDAVINGGGWWAKYYRGKFVSFVRESEFPEQDKSGNSVGQNWSSKGRGARPKGIEPGPTVSFSVRLYGRRYLDQGLYRFYSNGRGNNNFIRVKVGGEEVIASGNFQQQGDFESSGREYDIEIDYINSHGGAFMQVYWEKI